jgi:predicted kinase
MTIYFLIGLPASGKTTWAIAKLEYLNLGGKVTAVRVNKDDIRESIGATDGTQEGQVVRQEIQLVTQALSAGLDVIIDDTNLNPVNENRFRLLSKKFGYEFKIHSFLHIPLETCIRRDRIRSHRVGESTIRGMFNKYISSTTVKSATPSSRLLKFPQRS